MGRQDLAYQITVNDAQLRLATQHVAAFNAELEASTLTGRKVDERFRAIGRRTVQVGKFFERNITVPLAIGGIAAAKLAGDFDTSMAKIQGLVGATAGEMTRMRKAILGLAGKELTQGPTALANAMFFLRSVGLSTGQAIRALKPISEAASGGLGDVATVTEAVTSAMDAYGFANLSAAHATDVLVETVTKGKIPPDQLAAAIGRIIPLANAMGISFDQVGASLASMTRQGLNANLAVTGIRAILSTFVRAQPQTKKALASIGTSVDAVESSFKKIGVFPTLLALRKQFRGINVDSKTLTGALNGNEIALARVKAQVGEGNNALGKLFPNIRALTAFLILTGPRVQANAGIFRALEETNKHVGEATKRAFQAQTRTPIGQFRAELSKLKAEAVPLGDQFLKVGTDIVHFVGSILSFVNHSGPVMKHILKDIGIALFLIGPGITIFGRITQGVSGAITALGAFQARAAKAAFAERGISIEADKALIQTRKATVQMDEQFAGVTASAKRAATSVAAIGTSAQTSFAAAVAASRGLKVPPVAQTAAAATAVKGAKQVADPLGTRLIELQTAAQAKLALASGQVAAAETQLAAARARANAFGVSARIAGVGEAEASLQAARAAQKLAQTNLTALVPSDQKVLAIVGELTVAEQRLAAARQRSIALGVSARQAGVVAAEAQVLALQTQLQVQQRLAVAETESAAAFRTRALLASTIPQGIFVNIGKRDAAIRQLEERSTTAARIIPTKWGTALEGMKTASKFAFDFIALTFAVELADKIIFDSHRTKEAVVNDLFDIHKAGVGTFAALGLGAGLLGPKLIQAFKGLGGGSGAGFFEGLGIGALGFRGKIALALAAVLGLQTAGVHLETVFNAVFLGLGAKALLSSRIVTGVAVGLTRFLGGAGLAGAIERVGLGFLGWPVAIALAVPEIIKNVEPLRKAVEPIANFFAKHVDPHVPLIGGFLKKLDEGFSKAGDASDKAKDTTRDLSKIVGDISNLQPQVQQAIRDLANRGLDDAARTLAAKAEFAQTQTQVKKAITLLRSEGKKGVADLLGGAVAAAKAAKEQLDTIFGGIEDRVLQAFDFHTDRLLDAFDRKTEDILSAFDRGTSKMEEKLKATVRVPKLHETFTVTVNGKTPAERELDALDKVAQKEQLLKSLRDANRDVADAIQVGDPDAIRKAEEDRRDAERGLHRIDLERRARLERAAADKSLQARREQFDRERELQRRVIEDRQSSLRRNIEAQRSVEHDNLKTALEAQKALFLAGKIDVQTFYRDILGIMRQHNVSLAKAGHDGGKAYADALSAALDRLKAKATQELNAITKKAQQTTKALKDSAGLLKALAPFANVPGREGEILRATFPGVGQPGGSGGRVTNQQPGHPMQALLKALGGKLVNRGGGPELTSDERRKLVRGINAIGMDMAVPRDVSTRALGSIAGNLSRKGALDDLIVFLRTGKIKPAFHAASGGPVPGFGHGDVIPAMLSPREVVFNERQLEFLKRRLGIHGNSTTFFHKVDTLSRGGRNGKRFASGGPTRPIFGVDEMPPELRRLFEQLLRQVARGIVQRQNLVNDPRHKLLLEGGAFDKKGKFHAAPEATMRRLRAQLDPQHIESLVQHNAATRALPLGQKKQLEQSLAQAQAHPVSTGLIRPTRTGAVLGGRVRGAQLGGGHGGGGGGGGGGGTVQYVTIEIRDSRNPERTARAVRKELQSHAKRNANSRRGALAGSRVGAS